MSAAVQQRIYDVVFPPGFSAGDYVLALNHGAFAAPGDEGREYRRKATRLSPLLFALFYLPHYLDRRNTGMVSFGVHHLYAYRRIRRWALPREQRHVHVTARGGSKSVSYSLAGPLFALAHGHRNYFLGLSYTQDQARDQLANLRMELDTNEGLLRDFPELAPKRIRGARNTMRSVTLSGATFEAASLKATILGKRSGADRPDLIVGDDVQPGDGTHTPAEKAKLERKLIQDILPMGEPGRTVVQLCGTTTMYGCLMHDAVNAARGQSWAPWLVDHGFVCRHDPAILDAGTRRERSLWPQRWSLETLKAMEPRYYALNYGCDPGLAPILPGYWSDGLITHDSRVDVCRRVLYVDPAMTDGPKSDQTAIVVAGLERNGRRVVIEHAEQGRWLGEARRARCLDITQRINEHDRSLGDPASLRDWWVETNAPGDWQGLLRPPAGVKLHTEHVRGEKRKRIEEALELYQAGRVVHFRKFDDLEQQMMQWTPTSSRDDLLDALAGALRRLMPSF